ncbi:MAG: hypothetical protein WA208_02585 [Thermoanaerobaculia bacterium]
MRKLVLNVAAVAVVIAALAAYLAVTARHAPRAFKAPLSPAEAALLARVPADAEAFAFIPGVARIERELLENPVTRVPFEEWVAVNDIPRPWMLGDADAVTWRSGGTRGLAFRLDPVRRVLVRAWLLFTDTSVTAEGDLFLVNAPPSPGLTSEQIEQVVRLASQLPAADAMVVQFAGSKGAFPPIGRPAVSSVSVTSAEIVIVSRAASESASAHPPLEARLPRNALLSVAFAEPPRILRDVKRLVRSDIEALMKGGGAIALYDVDTGTLLPKPEAVISLPVRREQSAAAADLVQLAHLVGETRQTDTELLVSFDRKSLDRHAQDSFAPAAWPANRWVLRLDPARLVPILERLGDSAGLRLVAPRLHRGARDLRSWIGYLKEAEAIEAASSSSGGSDELRVRITSK